MEKNYEILSVEEEKAFLSSQFKRFYKVKSRVDEFEGTNETITSFEIYSKKRKTGHYIESASINLKVVSNNGNISYKLEIYYHITESSEYIKSLPTEDALARLSRSLKSLTLDEVNAIVLLTEEKERFVLKEPFDISEDLLPIILKNTTKFRLSIVERIYDDCDFKTIKEELSGNYDDIIGQIPFPHPYDVVRFVAHNGNLSDEEIDKLYDNVHDELVAIEKKEEAQKEYERKMAELEQQRKIIEEKSAPAPQTNENNGCFIATCVYGSYDCPEVWTLRRFRDYTLDESWYGRTFIKAYYAISPTLVKWFGKTRWFKTLFKKPLDSLVYNLKNNGVSSSPYIDKY